MSDRHGLSAFNLTMLALGTVVGGSFFLGSSIAMRAAGPAIIIAYMIGGGLVYFILSALSELTVADSAPGSFRTFAERAFGKGAGFITGWIYWIGMILAMSSEAIAVSVLLQQWVDWLPMPLLGSFVIISVTFANLLGAKRLSRLESGLAAIKIFAVVAFIITALLLIFGILPESMAIGLSIIEKEPLVNNGIAGIAGSMLIVMFTYAGFEIIGLAASETIAPHKTVPKAIKQTVIALTSLYITAISLTLLLTPSLELVEEQSPFVIALSKYDLTWAASAINIIMITAILSTMLAAMFGIGRMMRSIADEGHAPSWLKDNSDIPYKGILMSGIAMLIGLGMGYLLPKNVYLFLVSSSGFAILFTYFIILITHYKLRKLHGCPPKGQCQLPGYPYTSWFAILLVLIIVISMPFVENQGSGLYAGIALLLLISLSYLVFNRKKA